MNRLILFSNLTDLNNMLDYDYIQINGCIMTANIQHYFNTCEHFGLMKNNHYIHRILFDLYTKFIKYIIANDFNVDTMIIDLSTYHIDYTACDYFIEMKRFDDHGFQ
jgi:hypothetical protein